MPNDNDNNNNDFNDRSGSAVYTSDVSRIVRWAILAVVVLGIMWWVFSALPGSNPGVPNTGATSTQATMDTDSSPASFPTTQ